MKKIVMTALLVLAMSTAISTAVSADAEMPIVNGGFEEEANGTEIPGWRQTVGSGSVTLTNERSYSGTKSIYIEDQSATASYGLESQYIPVTVGVAYRTEVYTSAEESRGLVYLRFYDENYKRVYQTNVGTSYSSDWTVTAVEAQAPEGAVYATVLLYSAVPSIASVYFDDVRLYRVTEDDQGKLEPIHLGTPIESVVIPHAAYGQGPNGENWVYVVTNGSPSSVLSVLDVETGERVEALPIPGANYDWGNTTDPNGIVYMGSQRNGYLYRYVPGSGEVENLGIAIDGETHHWRIVSDEHGNIYGGTYPNGKVFRYDPVTRSFTDYGEIAEGEKYVRSIAYGDGTVYAGTGAVNAQIVALNPDTREKTSIPLPSEYQGQKEIYDLTYVEGLLFARITAHNTTSSLHNNVLVYDTDTQQWVDVLQSSIGFDVSPAREGKVYLWLNEYLYAYDIETLELMQTSFRVGPTATRGFGWYKLNQEEFPGESLVFSSSIGGIHIYNPQTDTSKIVKGDPKGAAVTLRSLHTGPDGNIYIGGYLSPNAIGVYDVEQDVLNQWAGMGQIEGMGASNGNLYMGVYPDAAVYEFDPTQPWDETKRANPIPLPMNLKEYGQDRPFALIEAGDELAVGTVGQVGKLGGALSLYNFETGETKVYKDLIVDESIMSLAYHNGLIYGGTSVWGGVSSEPTQDDATLFIFDPLSEQVIFEINPIPGERAVTSLVFDDEGILWGITNGMLFTFDPHSREVTKIKTLYPYEWSEIVLAAGTLHFYEGKLYGEAATNIFELDPETWEYRTIGSGNYFAQDRYGRIYTVVNSTELVRYDVDSTAPVTVSDAGEGWYNAPVTVTLTATDNLAGVDATYYRVLTAEVDGNVPFMQGNTVILNEDGMYTLEFYSVDANRNKEAAQSVIVRIDQTAPQLSLPESITLYPYEKLYLDFEVIDAGSGLDHVDVILDGETVTDSVYREPFTLSLGTHQIEVSAADLAGNAAASAVPVIVELDIEHVDELVFYMEEAGAVVDHAVTEVVLRKLYEAQEEIWNSSELENALNSLENMILAQQGTHLDAVLADYLLQLIDRMKP